MFSNLTIALLAWIGFGTWVYTKMHRQTGGNTTNSVVVGAGAGFVLFLIILAFLQTVFG